MALIKSIPDPNGPGEIDAYARYGSFLIDPGSRRVELAIEVFQSKAARDASDPDGRPLYGPIRTERYTMTDAGASGPDGPLAGAPNYAQYQAADAASAVAGGIASKIYAWIKAYTPWRGSADA